MIPKYVAEEHWFCNWFWRFWRSWCTSWCPILRGVAILLFGIIFFLSDKLPRNSLALCFIFPRFFHTFFSEQNPFYLTASFVYCMTTTVWYRSVAYSVICLSVTLLLVLYFYNIFNSRIGLISHLIFFYRSLQLIRCQCWLEKKHFQRNHFTLLIHYIHWQLKNPRSR